MNHTIEKEANPISDKTILLMKHKIYTKALIAGIITLIAFYFTFTFSYQNRNIRNKGKILKGTISEIHTRRGMTSIQVNIDGKDFDAGEITSGIQPVIGDSIEVCYIPGINRVVQKSKDTERYYLYFFLEFLILVAGVYLIIGGLLGKESDPNEVKKHLIKTVKKNDK